MEATQDREHDDDPGGWRSEGMDLLRAVAAGSIVGLPLLYTMEMWWHGTMSRPGHLLLLLGVMLLTNGLVSLFSGFREGGGLFEAVSESISATAIGLLVSTGILALIGEITKTSGFSETVGKIVIEAAPVSLGICFANSQIRGKSRTGDDDEEGDDDKKGGDGDPSGQQDESVAPQTRQVRQDLRDLAATLSGALIFSWNVAPTEEIVMIASRLLPWQHLLIVLVSLGLCYLIIFAAGFKDHQPIVDGPFQHPLAETLMAYAVSLVVSLVLLQLVGVPEATGSLSMTVMCTVTLGLVATVGASAGRLVT